MKLHPEANHKLTCPVINLTRESIKEITIIHRRATAADTESKT